MTSIRLVRGSKRFEALNELVNCLCNVSVMDTQSFVENHVVGKLLVIIYSNFRPYINISLNCCKDDPEIVEENYSLDDVWHVILESL